MVELTLLAFEKRKTFAYVKKQFGFSDSDIRNSERQKSLFKMTCAINGMFKVVGVAV